MPIYADINLKILLNTIFFTIHLWELFGAGENLSMHAFNDYKNIGELNILCIHNII
jgi:hypothetical protein